MKIEKIKINKLKPAEYNPRQITKSQFNQLKDSIAKFGLVDPIIINQNGNIVVGGHQRLKAMQQLNHTEIECVVLDLTPEEEKELNIRLNKNGGEWDFDLLSNFDIEELKDWGFKEIELGLNIDKMDENYTRKIKTPHYDPKNTKPSISELVDETKQKELLKKIKESNVNKEIKEFLIKATQRHLVFNYSKIADFYAHSDKETKELIEQSALVIIDYESAIHNGFVELSNDLKNLFDEEYN